MQGSFKKGALAGIKFYTAGDLGLDEIVSPVSTKQETRTH